MRSLTLYNVIRVSDGKHHHPTMGGGGFWSDVPDYQNATRDKDQAHGWVYNMKRKYEFEIAVGEILITW